MRMARLKTYHLEKLSTVQSEKSLLHFSDSGKKSMEYIPEDLLSVLRKPEPLSKEAIKIKVRVHSKLLTKNFCPRHNFLVSR